MTSEQLQAAQSAVHTLTFSLSNVDSIRKVSGMEVRFSNADRNLHHQAINVLAAIVDQLQAGINGQVDTGTTECDATTQAIVAAEGSGGGKADECAAGI